MELYTQQNHQPNNQENQQLQQQPTENTSFVKPYERFQRFINRSLQINALRFFVVTFIYYNADMFLAKTNRSSDTPGPWNSMIYFLAIMVEVIRFIGDFSLRNFLITEKTKLFQVEKAMASNTQPTTVLKAVPYEQFLDIFSLVRAFKFTHRNYASAFSISKYMHILCTFLTFGWMSLKQQFGQATLLQAATLWIFLISIFITTFEVDMFLIETSQGKKNHKNDKNFQRQLSSNERQDIEQNFRNWRNKNIIWQVSGMVFILCGLIANIQFSLVFGASITVCLVNLYAFYLETIIKRQLAISMRLIKRHEVNTYSVLNKSAATVKTPFRISIVYFFKYFRAQRLSTFLLWCAFVRDSTIPSIQAGLIAIGIFVLLIGQRVKFNKGNQLKLMMIRQIQYSNDSLSTEPQRIECAICLKNIENKQKVKVLPCSKQHIFHNQCLKDWNKYKTQCPLCRYQLSEYM